jgi:hypothetical protein
MIVKNHPIQLIMGSLLIQSELASKNGQLTFGIIAKDCIGWASGVKDVFRKIESDADNMSSRIMLYAADGVFDLGEREQLLHDSEMISEEAREGRLI